MSINDETLLWDLRDVIREITTLFPKIIKIFLFGSRNYMTNSLRSDIDILIFSSESLPINIMNACIRKKFKPIDAFITTNMKHATSSVNGSVINIRYPFDNLSAQLDATELWDKSTGYSNVFQGWMQQTSAAIDFKMSIITDTPQSKNIYKDTMDGYNWIRSQGIEAYYTGGSWYEISESIVGIVSSCCSKIKNFPKRKNKFIFSIADEYDFQNMIYFILRLIFPTIERENTAIILDGNEKKADFSICRNSIIIEAKHINSTGTKAAVLKTIDGLGEFYMSNPNVKNVIFLILYNDDVEIDQKLLNAYFSQGVPTSPLIVRFIKNERQ